jgi:hypothetical protein
MYCVKFFGLLTPKVWIFADAPDYADLTDERQIDENKERIQPLAITSEKVNRKRCYLQNCELQRVIE